MRIIICICVLCAGILSGRLIFESRPLLENMPYSTLALYRDGKPVRLSLAKDDKYRLPVRLDDISPEAVDAVLEYEDKYFFYHPGINLYSLFRGALSLFHGRKIGGSTLTMQVARLRYKLKTATLYGKLKQILYALGLELRYSKQEILEAYFNMAPYGGNIEGVEAASRIYFHKPAKLLTLQEITALAVIPQNPNARKPENNEVFEKARNLTRVNSNDTPLNTFHRLNFYSVSGLPFEAPHAAADILAGSGGSVRYSTLQKDLQTMIESALKNYTERESAYGIRNAAAILVDMNDMGVCALAGSANFFSKSIQGQIDGTKARRSPGSTLKPFIFALGLDQGLIHPATVLADSPKSFGGYDPENFDHDFKGPVPAAAALRMSRNLPAITLAERLHSGGLYQFLHNAHIKLEHSAEYYGLALVLGGAEISMRELATLYAVLGNEGLWRPLRMLETEPPAPPERILSREAAWLTAFMLRRDGAEIESYGQRIPVLYKTGTSNGFRDAWTAGIIGQYVLVVWAGNFDNSANPALVGATAALPLFEEMAVMLGSMRRLENKIAIKPDKLNLNRVQICSATGDIYKGQCEETDFTWFIPGISPVMDSGVYRRVLVNKTTGLRDCKESAPATEEVWMEFWPSDMLSVFQRAGIYKPEPPEWSAECRDNGRNFGSKPRIILPKRNVVYKRGMNEEPFKLPLLAAADRDSGKIHWFADNIYLGSSLPGETFFWNAKAGQYRLAAIDEQGRETSQKCNIESVMDF